MATVAATAALAGCGSGVDGSAVAGEPEDPWDPCSIPAEAIDAIGLDSTTKKTWGEGMNVPNWLLCYWTGIKNGTPYYFGIRFSAVNAVDEITANTAFEEVSNPYIEDRQGYQYRPRTSEPAQECDIALDTVYGVVNFDVSTSGGATSNFDTCDLVLANAIALSDHLPPGS